MKKIITLILFFIGISVFSQVSLKGYTLGEKLVGENIQETTVAGIEGIIMAQTIEDNRIYGIRFYVSDGDSMLEIFKYQLDFLRDGVEKNYGITLEYQKHDSSVFDYSLVAIKDDVSYKIFVEEIDGDEDKYKVALSIYSSRLGNKNLEEQQSDF